jgi:lipopolysaccharide transport system permease protein
LISNNFPGLVYLALLPVIVVLVVFAIGLGISLGVLNVFFRDVGQFFSIVIQFWFWLTPIVYPISILPESAVTLMQFNPLAILITACQDILVSARWPLWQSLLPVVAVSLVLCLLAFRLFIKHAGEMVDEL